MNRIKEVLEERQKAAQSGGTVSDSVYSECGGKGFDKR